MHLRWWPEPSGILKLPSSDWFDSEASLHFFLLLLSIRIPFQPNQDEFDLQGIVTHLIKWEILSTS
jgi:hypothetical protein